MHWKTDLYDSSQITTPQQKVFGIYYEKFQKDYQNGYPIIIIHKKKFKQLLFLIKNIFPLYDITKTSAGNIESDNPDFFTGNNRISQ